MTRRGKRLRGGQIPKTSYSDYEHAELLAEVDEKGFGLTRWEIEFVESLTEQKATQQADGRDFGLSPKQRARLEAIAVERLP